MTSEKCEDEKDVKTVNVRIEGDERRGGEEEEEEEEEEERKQDGRCEVRNEREGRRKQWKNKGMVLEVKGKAGRNERK